MIEVSDLSKSFGPVQALDRVSFDVGEGEILGFLGPNGAGKSTTMRILTGFMPGDSGRVRVAGHDVARNSLVVRQATGYLPEGVPVYPEMRVGEYLRYRARLKGIARRARKLAVDEALTTAGVFELARRVIGTLSRGYRQRVGLADALVGKPPVLILDEPTVGLDPEQVRQFRQTLHDVGQDRTVILSTHILSEVELVCSSVAIIQTGRIVARGTAEKLRQRAGASRRVLAEIAGPQDKVRQALEADSRVTGVSVEPVADREGDSNGAYHCFALDVLTDDALAKKLGAAGRERAQRLFSKDMMVDAYERLYESLLGG